MTPTPRLLYTCLVMHPATGAATSHNRPGSVERAKVSAYCRHNGNSNFQMIR